MPFYRYWFTCWTVNFTGGFSTSGSKPETKCLVCSYSGLTPNADKGKNFIVCGGCGAFRLICRLSVAVSELVGSSGVVVSLIVHRFYLTKKKVYLMGGKLQRSREKIKPFRQLLPHWCRSDRRVLLYYMVLQCNLM